MNYLKFIISSLALAGAGLATPALAGNAVLGGMVGGAAGAAVGHHVNGRNGAIVGAAIGGATGVIIAGDHHRSHAPRKVVHERVIVREQPRVYHRAPIRYEQPVHYHHAPARYREPVYYARPVERVVYVRHAPRRDFHHGPSHRWDRRHDRHDRWDRHDGRRGDDNRRGHGRGGRDHND